MITRSDLLMLGLSSGVTGALIGGLLLGVGMFLAANGVNIGWLMMIPAAPVAGLIGWALARRLAKQLDSPD